jgi:hypothetical protein
MVVPDSTSGFGRRAGVCLSPGLSLEMLPAEVNDLMKQLKIVGDAILFARKVHVDFAVVPSYEHGLLVGCARRV